MTLTRAVNNAITVILKGDSLSATQKKDLKQRVCGANAAALTQARALVTEALADYDPLSETDRARLTALRTGLACPKGLKTGGRTRRMKGCGRMTRRR
jgi:hypothetical protein